MTWHVNRHNHCKINALIHWVICGWVIIWKVWVLKLKKALILWHLIMRVHITKRPWSLTGKNTELVSSDSFAENGLVPLMHVKPKVWKETRPPTLHLHRAVDVITHTCQLTDLRCVSKSHVTYRTTVHD